MRVQVEEIKVGVHTLTEGTKVRVLPSRPKKRDGFEGRVLRLWERTVPGEDDSHLSVEVIDRDQKFRSVPLDRVRWMRQGGER